jgi:Ca2+-binding EF-hand superfamily protein
MGRKDFFKFYRSLRVESEDKVKEIANFVFTAFDRDSNGKIDFTEFLCKSMKSNIYSFNRSDTCFRWLCYNILGYDASKT